MNKLIKLTTELQKYIGKTAVFHIPGTKPDMLWGTIDCTDDREEKIVINEIHIYNYGIEIEDRNGKKYRIKRLIKIIDEDGRELPTDGIRW